MCGIAAILLYPQERTPAIWEEIKTIFSHNLVFNEARGKDATGLAVLQRDGDLGVYKTAHPASEVIDHEEYQTLLNSVNQDTTLILGHTRYPTKGDPSVTGNNHPLQAGPVFGVHNGTIKNDDVLFQQYGYPREADVDSEIIFRLLEPFTITKDTRNYLQSVQPRIQLLQGAFTFLAGDQRTPGKLLVMKHLNPLCLHFHAEWNALIFSSRYVFLRKSFGKSVVTEALPVDQLMLFDADRLPELGNEPAEQVPLFAVDESVEAVL